MTEAMKSPYHTATVRLDILKAGIDEDDRQARYHRKRCDEYEEELELLRHKVFTTENFLGIEKASAASYERRRDARRHSLEETLKDIDEGRAILV